MLALAELLLGPVDDHVHRVGVVGDRDVAAVEVRRGRSRAGVDLARLDDPRVRVLRPPDDLRLAALVGLEPVHPLVGDDVDAVRGDREGVLDLLVVVELDQLLLAGLAVEDADLRVLLRDEPDVAVEVGQRRGDPFVALVEDVGQVVVALHLQLVTGGADHEDVVGPGRHPDPVLLVEEEVAAPGEVLVLVLPGRVRRGRQVERVDRRQRVRVDDPGLRRERDRRADGDDVPVGVEGERAAQRRGIGVAVGDRVLAERAAAVVGIGHPGVVVDVRARVRRHERVLLGRRRVLDRLLRRRRSLVGRNRRVAGIADRRRRGARGQRSADDQDEDGRNDSHGLHNTLDFPGMRWTSPLLSLSQ